MTNKKILSGLLMLSVIIVGVGATFADYNNKGTGVFNGFRHIKGDKFGSSLTDEEKVGLKGMTTEEKHYFFQAKMEERRANMKVKEEVIDKLLAKETLTADQEELRLQIIEERKQRKIEMEERQAQMDHFRVIMEKKRNGEELRDDEQTILDNFKSNKKGEKRGLERIMFHR